MYMYTTVTTCGLDSSSRF